jgi:archaellum component FlaC
LNLQTDIANKIDLSTFTTQLGKKVDRDELMEMLSRFTNDEQKVRKMEKDLVKMKKKLNDSLELLDKKIKKLRKDLDIAYIQKILQNKANSNDVKQEVLRLDDNIKVSMSMFTNLRNDFENLVVSFKKIAQYIATLQEEETTGTLASTKGALCLSCGRGGPKFIKERKQVSSF